MPPADAPPARHDLQPLPPQGDTEDRAETVAPPTEHAPLARPTAALFRHRAFMRLWFSRLSGVTGNQMLLVALGWQMYDLTHSAWDLGLVGLLQFLPALALVLVAGQVIDRLHRARIVAACMAAQTVVAGLLIWGSATHAVSREMLFVVSIAVGTVRAFQMPTQQALTPMVLPPELLPRGLAFSSAGAQGAIVAGPAIGGFVYAAGPATVYATCAVLCVVAGTLVFGVRYEQAARVKKAISLETLLAGVRFVRDRLAKRPSRSLEELEPGEGDIVELDGEKVAGHRRDDGTLVAVSPTCTHLGCQVNWNRAERSWDCPCHGSRFDPLGRMLNGPSTRDLTPEPLPD